MGDPGAAFAAPILRRFPALASLPRVRLGDFPTAVEQVPLQDGRVLLVKRDDRSGTPVGGNKVRGLEWLLGNVRSGDHVLTVGPRGSTHALATATYARRLGARVTVARWNQEMNAAALAVDARIGSEARVIDVAWVPAAYAVAAAFRAFGRSRGGGGVRWIPAGGASPLAVLGHVNAALELADQVARGDSDRPARVIVPLGTGGTAAGLALGFRIAGLDTQVVAVRVVPRLLGRAGRVMKLARSTAKLVERLTGERIPRVRRRDIHVEHAFYGGGYGRPLPPAAFERDLETARIRLDDTYGRKALLATQAQPGERTLLWLTFDGSLLKRDG